jgi:transcriptional regulator with XRE-family HTH domain
MRRIPDALYYNSDDSGLTGVTGRLHFFHFPARISLTLQKPLWKNKPMIIGTRLRTLREDRKLSQGDIEKRTGLLRCYISRVENGHTVPSIETLEKLAAALGIPLYQIFYEGEEPPALPDLSKRGRSKGAKRSAADVKEERYFEKVRRLLSRVKSERDRELVLHLAQKLASR